MKRKWLIYGLTILFFVSAYGLYLAGRNGRFLHPALHRAVYPTLQSWVAKVTDRKFQWRGQAPRKQNVVIIAIDPNSIAKLGRWPWRRNLIAFLIHELFTLGVKVVGTDILFTEPQEAVPEEIADWMRTKGEEKRLREFDFDGQLAAATKRYRDRLVMQWFTESSCRKPLGECPYEIPAEVAEALSPFALEVTGKTRLNPDRSPIAAAVDATLPVEGLRSVVRHLGFPNGTSEADGRVRSLPLIMSVGGNLYPSFPLMLAARALDQPIQITLDAEGQGIERLQVGDRTVPVYRSGTYEINFRGESRTYPHLPASQVLEWAGLGGEADRQLASEAPVTKESLKDAIAIIGATAIGLSDIRATPFDTWTPGAEILANTVDNIISADAFSVSVATLWWIALLMTVGAALFLFAGERLEGRFFVPVVILVMSLLFGWDYAVLFRNHQNAPTVFLYAELALLAALALVFKYLNEEKKRKFIRMAFAKYVSPAVVDSLIQDPEQLSLGGRRETLTILFSDIRSFTTFSEKVEAKVLSQFLNEFHGMMTEVIFEHGGTLDKYIGDAVMAFWGAPLFQPDHADRAVRAAQKMWLRVQAAQKDFESRYGFAPQVGLGLHTGIVSVGNMGSEKSFGYTVIGDTVNLASRLEGATKQFGAGILTTQATIDSVRESGRVPLPHRTIGSVRTKGKKESVTVIEILPDSLPEAVSAEYEAGRSAFRQQRWAEAKTHFHAAIRQRGTDGPSAYYLELCDALAAEKLPTDWDGSWSLTEK